MLMWPQNVNPGLARQFAIENAFQFEDFDDDELREIMGYKLKRRHLTSLDAATNVAIEILSCARNRPNFGNAGELENLLRVVENNYQVAPSSGAVVLSVLKIR